MTGVRKTNRHSPELVVINIAEKCRQKLADDIIDYAPEVYNTLYANKNSAVFKAYMELYDLVWLQTHWHKLLEYVDQNKLTGQHKRELLSVFADWYNGYYGKETNKVSLLSGNANWLGNLLEKEILVLEGIVDLDKRINERISKVEIEFKKRHKIMTDRIQDLERTV